MHIVKLMGECNNRCIFCMVDGEIMESTHPPLDYIIREIETLPPSGCVDLFGGEPTLHPHFREILKHLKDTGRRFQIASHGRPFASKEFTSFVASTGPELVRTSLYGFNPLTHDTLTRTKNSFAETIAGLRNLISAKIPCVVNYLLLGKNVNEVSSAVEFLYGIGVRNFRFSLPINTTHIPALIPDLAITSQQLCNVLQFVDSHDDANFDIEKAPFCLAPNHLEHFFLEVEPSMIAKRFSRSRKVAFCAECAMTHYCAGIDPGHITRFGEKCVRPIPDSVRIKQTKRMSLQQLLAFEPIMPFSLVAISEASIDNANAVIEMAKKLAKCVMDGRTIGTFEDYTE